MVALFDKASFLSMRKLLHYRSATSLPPQGSNLDRLQRILQISEISDLTLREGVSHVGAWFTRIDVDCGSNDDAT